MLERDRDRVGRSRTLKWLAGTLAVLTLVGVGFVVSQRVVTSGAAVPPSERSSDAAVEVLRASPGEEGGGGSSVGRRYPPHEASGGHTPSAAAKPLPQLARKPAEIVPREATAASPTIAPNSIDAELAKLLAGNVAFNTPERAHVGQELSVQAILSTTLKSNDLTLLVTEPGKVETAPLKVSRGMIATLAGGAAFDISPSGPVTQWVSESEPTTWTWIVTPKTVGEQFLILTFDAIITLDGKDGKRSIRTFKKSIDVDVGWPQTVGQWMDLLKRWGEGVSYFWGVAIAVVGGGWAWLRRRGRVAKATTGQLSSGDDATG